MHIQLALTDDNEIVRRTKISQWDCVGSMTVNIIYIPNPDGFERPSRRYGWTNRGLWGISCNDENF